MEKKEPRKKAAALKYDAQKDAAPVLVAAGEGMVAERLIEKAHEKDIPVTKDSELVNVLTKLSVGDLIPKELYEVVAKILVFISNIDYSQGK